MNRTLSIVGMGAVLMSLIVGITGATGQNQYGSNFPIGPCGYIHGAFGNINGNFSWVVQFATAGGLGGTGPANAGASVVCVAQTVGITP